jgi:hypothetical protein
MDLPSIVGQIRFVRDALLVEGWCWSPEQPDRRLVVEIFADDRFVAAMVAAWLDPRVQRGGIGDGRHGFALTLPAQDGPGYRSVAARERQSGHVFARTNCDIDIEIDPFLARVDAVADTVPLLTAAVEETEPRDSPIGLRPALRELGYQLTARARTRPLPSVHGGAVPISVMRRRLADRLGGLRLPAYAHPAVSIILQAGSVEATARTIVRLAPALSELRAEVVLLDNGHNPMTSLLPSLLRNLRTVFDREIGTPCDAGNLGAAEARGDLLVFLDCGAVPPSAAALVEVARTVNNAPGLVIGQRLLDPMRQLGIAGTADRHKVCQGSGPLGLRVCLPRDLFMTLGQFDASVAEAPGLECADLLLKAELLGVRADIWREPPRALPTPTEGWRQHADIDAKRMLRALATFRTRWCGELHR